MGWCGWCVQYFIVGHKQEAVQLIYINSINASISNKAASNKYYYCSASMYILYIIFMISYFIFHIHILCTIAVNSNSSGKSVIVLSYYYNNGIIIIIYNSSTTSMILYF